jgi:glycosyltransferase involved in cell wall biosynthesis
MSLAWFRQKEASMNQTILIGHIALIQASKKQDFTLDVIKAIRDRGYDAVGVFAGECREREYMALLEQKVKELGLDNQVAFLGRRNDIPDLLKLIDVLMIPSSFEGFPLAGLEAAAAGVPVAACNVAGAKEFVEVSRAGKTILEDDSQQAADAILEVVRRKDEIRRNGQKFANRMTPGAYRVLIARQFQLCL